MNTSAPADTSSLPLAFERPGRCRPWLLLVIALYCGLGASAARTFDDFVLLLDTSGSMQTGNRIGKLKVALINFTNTLPADGSTRVWVFGYDADVRRITGPVELTNTDRLGELQLSLNSIPTPKGSATRTWPALQGVFADLAAAEAKTPARSVSIHLFTDGAADATKVGFADIQRLLTAARARIADYRLYFHVLDCEPAPEVVSAARREDGIYLVRGLAMPPQIVPDRALPPGTRFLAGSPQRWVGAAVGVAEAWHWEFGDGVTSTEASPAHAYQRSGAYTVTARARNQAGEDVRVFPIRVGSPAPQAGFESSGLFAGSETVVRDTSRGEATTREWRLDGAVVGDGPEWRHVFTAAGTHEITLAVTGPGGSDRKSASIRILPRTTAAFSWQPAQPLRGQAVAFVNESSNLSAPWRWEFGDGRSSEERNPVHTYGAAGSYPVKLSGTSLDGQSVADTRTVEIVVLPPRAAFELSGVPAAGAVTVGATLEVRDASSGTVETLEWNFGDGSTATGSRASHRYATAGTFAIVLTARGPAGSDTQSRTVVVAEPTWQLVARPQPGWLGEPVTFAVENPPADLQSLRWDFGDGSPSETRTSGNTAVHTYRTEGSFSAVAVATLAGSTADQPLTRRLEANVSVQTDAVTLDFSVRGERVMPTGPRSFAGPSPVTIATVNRSRGPIRSFTWAFGDGTTADDQSPVHTYRQPGTYVVTLRAVDQRDRQFATTDSQRFTIEVTGWRPPKAWRWPALAALIAILAVGWRWAPRQLRVVRYEVGEERRTARSWSADPVLRGGAATIRLRLRRTLFLRKRYELLDRSCEWLDARGEKPKRRWVENRDTLATAGETFTLRSLNHGISTARNTWLLILATAAATAALTWSLFV